jgi:hypothetical protein
MWCRCTFLVGVWTRGHWRLDWLVIARPIFAGWKTGISTDERTARKHTYLISIMQPIISTILPFSDISGKIDVRTHMGCFSEPPSCPGAFQVLLRRSSNDLFVVNNSSSKA